MTTTSGPLRVGRSASAHTEPTLLATPARLVAVKAAMAADPAVMKLYTKMIGKANDLLQQPPLDPEWIDVDNGATEPILLYTAREAERRTTILGLSWLLSEDERYAERLVDELDSLVSFHDWEHPSAPPEVFLSVAQMGAAVALGTDWAAGYINPIERKRMEAGLHRLILKPGLDRLRVGNFTHSGWPYWPNNWNIVCNGGITLAALVAREHDPEAAEALALALDSVKLGFAFYAPEGAWNEGPSYWALATRYAAMMISALEDTATPDGGLSAYAGFSTTGDFVLHTAGPSGVPFNFSDCDDSIALVPLGWTGTRFNRPQDTWLGWYTLTSTGFSSPSSKRLAFSLLWQSGPGQSPATLGLRNWDYFPSVEMVAWRSCWDDSEAGRTVPFFAFKAGTIPGHHTHFDLGTFVYEALGERWAIDLGNDNYGLPGYFEDLLRGRYYRLSTAGHNTLVIGGVNQPDTASTPLDASGMDDPEPHAIADLSVAYSAPAGSVRRGLRVMGGAALMVRDEIAAWVSADIGWGLHTRATVTLSADGRTALLEQNGRKLEARLLLPASARFTVASAWQPPPQDANTGVSKLSIALPECVGHPERRVVEVLLVPEGTEAGPDGKPLAHWPAERPVTFSVTSPTAVP
jgi:hypothetical protein